MYAPSGPIGGLLRLCLGRPIFFFVPVIVALVITGSFDSGSVELIDPQKAYYPYGCGGLPISYAFDDGYVSVYEEALPVLERLNQEFNLSLTATAYVITGQVGQSGYMSLAQLKELSRKGWEVGSHTVTHPDLSELNDGQLFDEIVSSRGWLENKGFEVFSIASPYGRYNPSVINIAKSYYYAHRGTVEGLNDIPLRDPANDLYELKTVFYEGDMEFATIKDWVDRAFAEGKYLIISFHRVTDKTKVMEEALPYTTDVKDFERLTRYILSKAGGYQVVCSEEMPKDLPNLPFAMPIE